MSDAKFREANGQVAAQANSLRRAVLSYITKQEALYGVVIAPGLKYGKMAMWSFNDIDDYFNELVDEKYEKEECV